MRSALAALTIITAALLVAMPALAKLPALSDEAKAKAAEAAAKTAWTDKIGAYKLCMAMERTAAYYRKSPTGASAPAPLETPACADPGPFAAAAPATPPLEASGAHSPATMMTSPPGSKATANELQGPAPKK